MGNKRKAQISQIFLVITALLVVGASVYLGGTLIYRMLKISCQANDVELNKDITDMIESHIAYGSSDEVKISAPCNVIALCFVDADMFVAGADTSNFQGNDLQINISVKRGVKNNIFKQYRDHIESLNIYDERIILRDQNDPAPNNDLCIPSIGGEFTFDTHGFGRHIEITAPPS